MCIEFKVLIILIFILFSTMCECKDMSMDVKTPRNVYLSAFYKRSFAYYTVKHRLPIILTQLLDTLVRNKDDIAKQFGEGAREDLKEVIGEISKFIYEIQTNKPLPLLVAEEPDVPLFNDYINKQATEEGHTTYFNTIWLLVECYMYRRIKQIFTLTDTLKDFDYFQSYKREAFEKSLSLMSSFAQYLVEHMGNNKTDLKEQFIAMLKANLWGNKFDLSISLGKVEQQGKLSNTDLLEENILSNHSEEIWEAISAKTDNEIVDIVLDNAGYEVFTDFCLAGFLLERNLAKKIRIYVKAVPWFISDVMEHDVPWVINELKNSTNANLKTLGHKWGGYINEGKWEIVVDRFWTLPFEFKVMKTVDPNLYRKLSEAKLIFFKGDLNYRKLFGEINWEPTISVEEALQGFHPAKLATLRTIKADIVVGLPPGVAEKCEKKDEKWMEKGDYGLIQFCDKVVQI